MSKMDVFIGKTISSIVPLSTKLWQWDRHERLIIAFSDHTFAMIYSDNPYDLGCLQIEFQMGSPQELVGETIEKISFVESYKKYDVSPGVYTEYLLRHYLICTENTEAVIATKAYSESRDDYEYRPKNKIELFVKAES